MSLKHGLAKLTVWCSEKPVLFSAQGNQYRAAKKDYDELRVYSLANDDLNDIHQTWVENRRKKTYGTLYEEITSLSNFGRFVEKDCRTLKKVADGSCTVRLLSGGKNRYERSEPHTRNGQIGVDGCPRGPGFSPRRLQVISTPNYWNDGWWHRSRMARPMSHRSCGMR